MIFPFIILFNSLLAACGRPSLFTRTMEFRRLERLARISYVTDFKGLGSVFGSYCVDLKLRCGRKERSVPRMYALQRLLLEDSIQTFLQLYYVGTRKVVAVTELFVMFSIGVTVLNFVASIFNIFITAGAKTSPETLNMFPGTNIHSQHYFSQLTLRIR